MSSLLQVDCEMSCCLCFTTPYNIKEEKLIKLIKNKKGKTEKQEFVTVAGCYRVERIEPSSLAPYTLTFNTLLFIPYTLYLTLYTCYIHTYKKHNICSQGRYTISSLGSHEKKSIWQSLSRNLALELYWRFLHSFLQIKSSLNINSISWLVSLYFLPRPQLMSR